MATPDPVPPIDRFPVSATLYTTYLRCPQQAVARVQGVYPEPSVASFRGALAHRLFARHLSVGPITDHDLPSACREETGANLNGQLAAIGLKPSEFRNVVSEVSELYRRFSTVPMDGMVEAEVSFEDEVGDGVVLRGRMDAVFRDGGGVRIVDWKTGANLGDDVDAQLKFYALAWQKRNGERPQTLEAMSLKTGERRSMRPTASDVASVEEEIRSMVEVLRRAIAEGSDLDRRAGPHCRWCPLLPTCSEGTSAVAIVG